MSVFVLVHGAWQGASTWDLVVPKLRAAGHDCHLEMPEEFSQILLHLN